uniref:Uncharacterized protein n=1 Tax=Arion vulgaris TaxID=1028688 RepID=A0A0B7AD15_9EUPU
MINSGNKWSFTQIHYLYCKISVYKRVTFQWVPGDENVKKVENEFTYFFQKKKAAWTLEKKLNYPATTIIDHHLPSQDGITD